MSSKFYAVRTGRKTGIFSTWDEAKPLVDGFKGNEHKAFRRLEDAEDYLRQGRIDANYQNVEQGMRAGNPGKGARPEAPRNRNEAVPENIREKENRMELSECHKRNAPPRTPTRV